MIARGHLGASVFTLTLRDTSFTMTVDGREVFTCDRAGRLYSIYREGKTYRRSLSGRIQQKWQGEAGRLRRWLQPSEAAQLIDYAAGTLRRLPDGFQRAGWTWSQPPGDEVALAEVRVALERGAAFDSRAAALDAQRFHRVYSPIGILPPDQYLALVLQATEGCSFRTCTFCNLYEQPFRVKSPAEFSRHIAEVREYLGESLRLRNRSIFLGAANALAVPMPRLLPLFEAVARSFDTTHQGIYAFVDAFTGQRKDVADYRALAELGLRRVYIGLESGYDSLLEFVHKPSRAADTLHTVHTLQAAGVNAGVIVLIGLGGDRYAAGHVAATVDVLRAMDLGPGDLLYFSELVEEPGTPYPLLAARHGIRALSSSERQAQREAILAGLALSSPSPKVSNYDVREFVY